MQKEACATASQQYQQHDSHRPHASPPVCSSLHHKLVAWHSGRTSVSDWQTFPVLRSTCKRVWENFYIIRLRAYDLLLQPRPSCTSRLTGWLFQCYTDTTACGPLFANMTSSMKPEVHNVSQRRQRRTVPRTQVTCKKCGEDRTRSSRDIWSRTDSQTDTVITILCFPYSVIVCSKSSSCS